ncbi:MAG: cysteine desulfurase family protein [Oscillospiraceae bacterium]|nr:cysteine desulfurase family protein [Clostridiaceae bacterium]MDY5947888.1 cysteine desulfurase family protein [Oscillospiraceae bacterium]
MNAYFDNSATTAPCCEAVKAVSDAMTRCWGNPSSLHFQGNLAKELLDNSREAIAARLSCKPEEIFFTSGGTESNNLAVRGAAYQMRRMGRRIVSTSIEHPSIDETLNKLEAEGFEVIKLKVDSFGRINEKELFAAVNSNTVLITMMLVNNEVGTVMPIQAAKRAAMAARSPALIHCDAVQAFGKMPIKPSALGVDLMTVSSHKIHGPKGVGALYVRKGVKIKPVSFGGEQEHKLRPGTEAMPAIAGFAAAAKALPDPQKELERISMLRDYMVSRLGELDDIVINSPPDALPFVTNISVLGIKSEPMLNFLSERGICVSSGSACSKGKKSHVLLQMGLDKKRLDSPLRISFSRFTTVQEIDALVLGISEGKKVIRAVK